MKKIVIFIFCFIAILPWQLFAAQKSVTNYFIAGDMGVYSPNPLPPPPPVGDFAINTTTSGISVDTSNNTINLGNNTNNTSGSIWYGGNGICSCVEGKCNFGVGLRAYFEFTVSSTDSSASSTDKADGFTFAIINGLNNNKNSMGGPPATISIGELLGYGGPGRTDALGLRPPKMAIEFDTYPNGDNDVCDASSRDDADNNNHIALMFWGNNLTGNCTINGTNYPKSTFDDNRHGNGSGNNPVNSYKNDGSGGYYAGARNGSYNWLEDNQLHLFRIEITRATTAVGGMYSYNIKSWVDCPSCTAGQLNTFKDITTNYSALAPQINRTVQLTEADHLAFETMLFGFTEGTGGANQKVEIKNFNIYFPTCCSYVLNPVSAAYDSAAHSGNTLSVTAASSCSWTAISSNTTWLSVTAGSSGVGNGTVTYDVSQNFGSARSGKINIANKTFDVSQAACSNTLTLSPTALTVARAAGSGSITVGMTCNYNWTAVSNNSWITIDSGSSGTGSGTIDYSYSRYNGASGTSRTGTITVTGPGGMTQTFTLTQTRP